MHELILFGRVLSVQYVQALKILAGVAAMQPSVVSEWHLIFQPKKLSANHSSRVTGKPSAPISQVQTLQAQMQGDLFYLQLVSDISSNPSSAQISSTGKSEDSTMTGTLQGINRDDTELGDAENEREPFSADRSAELKRHEWSIEFRDLPEVAGRRPVTSRLMASVPISIGSPLLVMDALDYTYASEYLLQGHRLIHGNITLFLHQTFIIPPQSTAETGVEPFLDSVFLEHVPQVQNLKPLDPSGSSILQASIRVQDGTKPESMTMAIAELMRFREQMRGIIDMEVGDRLALNTRMR